MKAKLFTLVSFILLTTGLVAQPDGRQRMSKEEIATHHVAFLSSKLKLTPEEAQVFWPVFNAYSDELDAIRKERRTNLRTAKKNKESMSDAEILTFLDKDIELRRAEVDVMEKYHGQFKEIITPQKLAKLYHAEEDFKRYLMEMMRPYQG